MKGMEFSMRHIIDLSDLTDKEFNDLYKLTTNIIDAGGVCRCLPRQGARQSVL